MYLERASKTVFTAKEVDVKVLKTKQSDLSVEPVYWYKAAQPVKQRLEDDGAVGKRKKASSPLETEKELVSVVDDVLLD